MLKHMCLQLVLLITLFYASNIAEAFKVSYIDSPKSNETDSLRWFPNEPKPSLAPHHKGPDMFKWINDTCDNGKLNLTVDWDFSRLNYSCYDTADWIPDPSIPSELYSKVIPPAYRAAHLCMNEEIHYDTNIPMFANHRPAWAKWGEYSFLPKQRWLHNLEHGAIVMLYHPCTHPEYVNALRKVVTNCLYRHIISADNTLSRTLPMALVAWGHKLLLSYPSEKTAREFIKKYAKKGAEQTSRQGYYDELLIHPAQIVSDLDDKELCPKKEKR